jgi:hypothetical protein
MESQPTANEHQGVPSNTLPGVNFATSANAITSTDKNSNEGGAHDTAAEKAHKDKQCLFFRIASIGYVTNSLLPKLAY